MGKTRQTVKSECFNGEMIWRWHATLTIIVKPLIIRWSEIMLLNYPKCDFWLLKYTIEARELRVLMRQMCR